MQSSSDIAGPGASSLAASGLVSKILKDAAGEDVTLDTLLSVWSAVQALLSNAAMDEPASDGFLRDVLKELQVLEKLQVTPPPAPGLATNSRASFTTHVALFPVRDASRRLLGTHGLQEAYVALRDGFRTLAATPEFVDGVAADVPVRARGEGVREMAAAMAAAAPKVTDWQSLREAVASDCADKAAAQMRHIARPGNVWGMLYLRGTMGTALFTHLSFYGDQNIMPTYERADAHVGTLPHMTTDQAVKRIRSTAINGGSDVIGTLHSIRGTVQDTNDLYDVVPWPFTAESDDVLAPW